MPATSSKRKSYCKKSFFPSINLTALVKRGSFSSTKGEEGMGAIGAMGAMVSIGSIASIATL